MRIQEGEIGWVGMSPTPFSLAERVAILRLQASYTKPGDFVAKLFGDLSIPPASATSALSENGSATENKIGSLGRR